MSIVLSLSLSVTFDFDNLFVLPLEVGLLHREGEISVSEFFLCPSTGVRFASSARLSGPQSTSSARRYQNVELVFRLAGVA